MENYKRLSSDEMREQHVSKFKQKYSKRKNAFSVLKKVFHYSKEYRWYFYLALFLDIIFTLTTVLIPVYTGYSINCIISEGNVNFPELYKNMLIIAGLSITSFLTNFSQQVCLAKFNYKGTYKIRDLLFEKLQKLDNMNKIL